MITMTEFDNQKSLLLDSNGQCCFCQNRISESIPGVKQETSEHIHEPGPLSNASACSLRYLTRYLKVGIRKRWPISISSELPHDHKGNGDKLNVWLCEECCLLTDEFSKLYGKLEKIEMEIASCLNFLHRRLTKNSRGEGSASTAGSKKHATKFARELRKNLIRKCSRKIKSTLPKVRIRRVRIIKIIKRPVTHQSVTASSSADQQPHISVEPQRIEDGNTQSIDDVTPDMGDEDADDEDNNCDGYLPLVEHVQSLIASLDPKLNLTKCDSCQQNVPDLSTHHCPLPINIGSNVGHIDDNVEQQVAGKEVQEQCPGTPGIKTSNKIPKSRFKKLKVDDDKDRLPIKSRSPPRPYTVIGPGTSSPIHTGFKNLLKMNVVKVNPETGQRDCSLCPKTFKNIKTFRRHYRSAHLELKYKCKACELIFPQGDNCTRHFRSVHQPLVESRYRCPNCHKVFQRKDHLVKHQRRRGNSCNPSIVKFKNKTDVPDS